MVASFVLIAGVIFIMVIGAIVLAWMGATRILISLVPLAPLLVMVGTVLLILTELPLFIGSKDDRRSAWRDLSYLFPTLLISGALWYVAQLFW